jgi:hypothetical protein
VQELQNGQRNGDGNANNARPININFAFKSKSAVKITY